MPQQIEADIRREYEAKGKTGEALDHAVYGTLNKAGLMHGNKITPKGQEAEKHEAMRRAMDKLGKYKK